MTRLTPCLRVYLNGDRVVQHLTHFEAKAEVRYNLTHRPGVAFFVGTECRQTGYLSVQQCMDIVRELERS